jgi:hypothetical protein
MNVHLIGELSDSTNNINEAQGINNVFVPQTINAFFSSAIICYISNEWYIFFLKIQAKIEILISLLYIHT